jgi:hypothetical protein
MYVVFSKHFAFSTNKLLFIIHFICTILHLNYHHLKTKVRFYIVFLINLREYINYFSLFEGNLG